MAADEEERIYVDGRAPLKAYLGQLGCIVGLLFGWNLLLPVLLWKRYTLKLKVTNQHVVLISGLISQHEEDIALYRANDCSFRQNVLERILGTGSIKLISDDNTAPVVEFICERPRELKESIRTAILEERRKRRALLVD